MDEMAKVVGWCATCEKEWGGVARADTRGHHEEDIKAMREMHESVCEGREV